MATTEGGSGDAGRNRPAWKAAPSASRWAARSAPNRPVIRCTCLALMENSASTANAPLARSNEGSLPPAYSILANTDGLYPSPPNRSRSSRREKNLPASRTSPGRPFAFNLAPAGVQLPNLQLRLLRRIVADRPPADRAGDLPPRGRGPLPTPMLFP